MAAKEGWMSVHPTSGLTVLVVPDDYCKIVEEENAALKRGMAALYELMQKQVRVARGSIAELDDALDDIRQTWFK